MNLAHQHTRERARLKLHKDRKKNKNLHSPPCSEDLVSIAAAAMQDQLPLEASSCGKPK